jgi:hypothetical protein
VSVVSVVSVECRCSGALRSAALALQQAPAEQQICAHKPAGIIANRFSQKLDRPPSSSLLLDIASRISALAPSAAHSAQRSQHQQIIPRSGAHRSLLALLLQQNFRRHTAAASAISHSSRSRHRPSHHLPQLRSALPQPPAVMTPQHIHLRFQSLSCELSRFASAAVFPDARCILKVRIAHFA